MAPPDFGTGGPPALPLRAAGGMPPHPLGDSTRNLLCLPYPALTCQIRPPSPPSDPPSRGAVAFLQLKQRPLATPSISALRDALSPGNV